MIALAKAVLPGELHRDVGVVAAGQVAIDPQEAVALVAQVEVAGDAHRFLAELGLTTTVVVTLLAVTLTGTLAGTTLAGTLAVSLARTGLALVTVGALGAVATAILVAPPPAPARVAALPVAETFIVAVVAGTLVVRTFVAGTVGSVFTGTVMAGTGWCGDFARGRRDGCFARAHQGDLPVGQGLTVGSEHDLRFDNSRSRRSGALGTAWPRSGSLWGSHWGGGPLGPGGRGGIGDRIRGGRRCRRGGSTRGLEDLADQGRLRCPGVGLYAQGLGDSEQLLLVLAVEHRRFERFRGHRPPAFVERRRSPTDRPAEALTQPAAPPPENCGPQPRHQREPVCSGDVREPELDEL